MAPPKTMPAKRKPPPVKAAFIESMECLPLTKLPDGPGWTYEIKLDGHRLEAVKQSGETILYSRRGNILNQKFQYIADALKNLPDSTILDGEVVALNAHGSSQKQWCASISPSGPAVTSRHTKYVAFREDKDPRKVVKEDH